MGLMQERSARLRRLAVGCAVIGLSAAALLPADLRASASLSAAGHVPVEQRIAIAVGPERTTLWSQLALSGSAGQIAFVVPAPDGSSIDLASDAWFEALEAATAPRVVPPAGADSLCPGISLDAAVDVVGQLGHTPTAVPAEVVLHENASEVAIWALSHDIDVPVAAYEALAEQAPARFVSLRFAHVGGTLLTPTIRVTTPHDGSAVAAFPTVLSSASDEEDLALTLWTLAGGRASLAGAVEGSIDEAELVFDAAEVSSNFEALRRDLLWSADGTAMVEASSHSALVHALDVGNDAVAIDPVVTTYFERAALYAGVPDPAECIDDAVAALGTDALVSRACPAASLGSSGVAPACDEVVDASEVDAAMLRCFAADDLAVGLYGMRASEVTLTRHRLLVAAGSYGDSYSISVIDGETLLPIWSASQVDDSGCSDGGGGSGDPGGGSGSGKGKTRRVPVYQVHDGCDGRYVGDVLYYVSESIEVAPSAYYVENGDCGGSTTAAYEAPDIDVDADVDVDVSTSSGDDCGGDSPDGYDGDDCGGDSPDGYDAGDDCGGDAGSGDDCGGDASGGDSCSGDGASGADCGGDAGSGADCGGDAAGAADCGGDCSLGGKRRSRMPRFSILVMMALVVAVPLRRLTRPK